MGTPFVDDMPSLKLMVPESFDDEPGAYFEIRILSWKELEECRSEQYKKTMRGLHDMGGEVIEAMARVGEGKASREAQEAVAQARAEIAAEKPRAGEEFDAATLVAKAVVDWSYERHFQRSLLDRLNERVFKWLFEEIAAVQTLGDEQAGKGDSGDSSAT